MRPLPPFLLSILLLSADTTAEQRVDRMVLQESSGRERELGSRACATARHRIGTSVQYSSSAYFSCGAFNADAVSMSLLDAT